jgi:hypothetical protein
MSKYYQVIIDVVAPQGFDDEFDPYDAIKGVSLDDLLEKQGGEIQNIEVREIPD